MATKKSKADKGVKYRRKKLAKVYKNSEGKVVYKQSTDKVGDVLVNPAGVKYQITGERFAPATGYDDGKLKVRILQIKMSTGQMFEINDGDLKYYQDNNILTRERKLKLKTIKEKAKADKPVAQRSQKSRSTNVAKVQSEAATRKTGAKVQSRQATPKSAPAVPKTAPAAAKSSQSFTVKAGRTTRTFASKAEAKAYAKQCKNRNVTVTPSTRKPTHKIVSFTAKK